MGLHRMQNQEMGLSMSTDAKPRQKWTPELHRQFVEAATQLGGADKATPKTLMKVMGIPGLTLYHLKSHLQKYRLGKILPQSQTCSNDKQEDYGETQIRGGDIIEKVINGTRMEMNESVQINQALHMQMEVQKKLHEQIAVQRHLQLRIEAQDKYLQSVVKKAQDTLAGYNSSSIGLEATKAELSQLVSMVDTGNSSSWLPGLTETGGDGTMKGTHCSPESSGRTEEKQKSLEGSNQVGGLKRGWSTISDNNCFEQESTKRWPTHKESRKFGLSEKLDLNNQYQRETD